MLELVNSLEFKQFLTDNLIDSQGTACPCLAGQWKFCNHITVQSLKMFKIGGFVFYLSVKNAWGTAESFYCEAATGSVEQG